MPICNKCNKEESNCLYPQAMAVRVGYAVSMLCSICQFEWIELIDPIREQRREEDEARFREFVNGALLKGGKDA